MSLKIKKYKSGGYSKKSSQSIRDYERIRHRVNSNLTQIEFISNFLDRYFHTHVTAEILLNLANIFIKKLDLKIDRLAKRNRSALLCWYAENWDSIYPHLKGYNFYMFLNKCESHEDSTFNKEQTTTSEPDENTQGLDPSNILSLLNTH